VTGLVVLGVHRSGTSALAGALQSLGFEAGAAPLPPNVYNESGYFEDSNVIGFNDALLHRMGRSWSDARMLPPAWEHQAWAPALRHEGAATLRHAYDLRKPWVLKDPRLCRVLPLWRQVFSDLKLQPGYLISLRHPLAVASSLQHRDDLPAQWACVLYAIHLLEAEQHTRGCLRAVVTYPDLVQDWRTTLRNAFQALGATQPEVSEASAQLLDEFLDPRLTHCGTTAGDWTAAGKAIGRAATLASRVYELLSRAEPFAEPHRFDELRSELSQYLEDLDPWVEAAVRGRQERDDALSGRERVLHFLRQGGWQYDQEVERWFGEGALSVAYWRGLAETEYSEQRAVRVPLAFSGEQQLRFVLPQESTSGLLALRWDISDRPAACEVRGAWVEDPQGRQVWNWEHGTSLLVHESVDLKVIGPAMPANGLLVFASGSDPYADLQLPGEVLRSMRAGWVFTVVISARIPTSALQWLRTTEESPCEAVGPFPLGLSAELEKVSSSLQAALARRDQTISQQRHQVEQARLEVVRAQAQLQLLESLLENREGTRYVPLCADTDSP
jgi:hypothetical protein